MQLRHRSAHVGTGRRLTCTTPALPTLQSPSASARKDRDRPSNKCNGSTTISKLPSKPKTRSASLDQAFFTSACLGDLNNPIHPIFRRENFVDFSNIHYPVLETSLRLASRFITTPQLLPFWYMVLCGTMQVSSKSQGPLPQTLTSLTPTQEDEVAERLDALSSCVTFSSEKRRGGDAASTERLPFDAPTPFKGVKSHIHISHRVFTRVERCFSKHGRATTTSLPWLWSHFVLANLLLHELTHAAMLAAHPRPPASDPIQAYFLPGSRTTEEGLEWEASVFGGIMYEIPTLLLRWHNDEFFQTTIVLREWPSPRLVAKYTKTLYPRPFPVKGELPTQERVWVVPHDHVNRLFTTNFWDKVILREDARALQPRCEESYVERGVLGLLTREAV